MRSCEIGSGREVAALTRRNRKLLMASEMTDHELQLKAIALCCAAFCQPEWLEYVSPGLREALPWACVPKNSLHPERVREPATLSTALAPLQGAKHFLPLTQGSLRFAPATLGWIPVALQVILRVAPHHNSKPLEFERFNCGEFAIIKQQAAVLIPSNSRGLELASGIASQN